jgi:hypothetical protein
MTKTEGSQAAESEGDEDGDGVSDMSTNHQAKKRKIEPGKGKDKGTTTPKRAPATKSNAPALKNAAPMVKQKAQIAAAAADKPPAKPAPNDSKTTLEALEAASAQHAINKRNARQQQQAAPVAKATTPIRLGTKRRVEEGLQEPRKTIKTTPSVWTDLRPHAPAPFKDTCDNPIYFYAHAKTKGGVDNEYYYLSNFAKTPFIDGKGDRFKTAEQ